MSIGKSFMKYIMETNYLEMQVTMELRGDCAHSTSQGFRVFKWHHFHAI